MKKLLIIAVLAALALLATSQAKDTNITYKTMYMPCTRVGEKFYFGFETTPNYKFTVLSSTNGGVNWQTYTNFVATGYSHSMVIDLDGGPANQLFRVMYEPCLTNGQ